MKITITANTIEEAEFGLGCIRQVQQRTGCEGVVVRAVNGELDFSMVAVVNKSVKGNYSAKVNQK